MQENQEPLLGDCDEREGSHVLSKCPTTPVCGRRVLVVMVCVCVGVVLTATRIVYTSRAGMMRSTPTALSLNAGCEREVLKQTHIDGLSVPVPRVFCMVFTTPDKWRTRGQALYNTWVQRCSVFRFFYSRPKHQPVSIPHSVALDVPEGRDHLTGKTLAALRESYKLMGDRVDWYLKADDDTYIVYDNLVIALSGYNASQPRYVGRTINNLMEHGYNSGGAGYCVSHPAAAMLINKTLTTKRNCRQDGGLEDADIGQCLAMFGVYPEHTKDPEGLLTFHSDNPFVLLDGGQGNHGVMRAYAIKKWGRTFGNPSAEDVMLSPHTVSLHYIPPAFMYFIDYLLYDLRRHKLSDSTPPWTKATARKLSKLGDRWYTVGRGI